MKGPHDLVPSMPSSSGSISAVNNIYISFHTPIMHEKNRNENLPTMTWKQFTWLEGVGWT